MSSRCALFCTAVVSVLMVSMGVFVHPKSLPGELPVQPAFIGGFVASVWKCTKHPNVGDLYSYGNFCGMGGNGTPADSIDVCCGRHDACWQTVQMMCPQRVLLAAGYEFTCGIDNVLCYENSGCDLEQCYCESDFVKCLNDHPVIGKKPDTKESKKFNCSSCFFVEKDLTRPLQLPLNSLVASKTVVIDNTEAICFSFNPMPVCPHGMAPVATTKDYAYYQCLLNSNSRVNTLMNIVRKGHVLNKRDLLVPGELSYLFAAKDVILPTKCANTQPR